MEKYDVIIVGGGPSGSTAAYYIDKLSVLIVDKFDFPRPKACGGGLLNCRDWHLEFENYKKIEKKLTKFPVSSVRAYWNKMPVASFEPNHFFDQVKRYEFDDLLLKTALEKTNVTFQKFCVSEIKNAVMGGEEGFLLSDGNKEIFGSYLIGADGAYSVVSRFLGNNPPTINQSGICLEFDIISEKKSTATHLIGGFGREIGYAWIFPTIDGYYIGLGIVRKPKKPLKKYLDDLLAWGIKNDLIPKDYKIRNIFGGTDPLKVPKKYCDDRVMLCGDAMGLVKALSGEGIYYALKSGKIAGQVLSKNLDNIQKNYKKKIRPVIWDVFITPYMPHRLITVTFFSIIFHLSLIPLPFGLMQKIRGFVFDIATRRNKLPKNSYYTPFRKINSNK